jgi:uncharacterized membrane protein
MRGIATGLHRGSTTRAPREQVAARGETYSLRLNFSTTLSPGTTMNMKLKPLVLAALVALGVAGFAEARNAFFAEPSPEMLLSITSEKLALDPAQQDQLRPLLQRAVALRADIKNKADAMRAASRAELARPDADLRALSDERQALIVTELKAIGELRKQFLAFYEDDLSPGQQAMARQLMIKRLDHFDRLRDRMLAMANDGALQP